MCLHRLPSTARSGEWPAWFSFWFSGFLGAGGRLPMARRGRVYCEIHHHQRRRERRVAGLWSSHAFIRGLVAAFVRVGAAVPLSRCRRSRPLLNRAHPPTNRALTPGLAAAVGRSEVHTHPAAASCASTNRTPLNVVTTTVRGTAHHHSHPRRQAPLALWPLLRPSAVAEARLHRC